MVFDEGLRNEINNKGITSDRIRQSAVQHCGMNTLYWNAVEKVRQGITSLEEVLARIRQDDFDSRPDSRICPEFREERTMA